MLLVKSILGRMAEASLKGLESPQTKLEKGDKVIGVLSDDLKRLYSVMINAAKKVEHLKTETIQWIESFEEGREVPADENKAKKEKFFLAHNDHQTAYACFWGSVKNEFPEISEQGAQLCEKWQVVIPDPMLRAEREAMESLQKLFEHLRS